MLLCILARAKAKCVIFLYLFFIQSIELRADIPIAISRAIIRIPIERLRIRSIIPITAEYAYKSANV